MPPRCPRFVFCEFAAEGEPVADGAQANRLVDFEQRGWPAEDVLSCVDLVGQDDPPVTCGLGIPLCGLAWVPG